MKAAVVLWSEVKEVI